MNFDGRDIANYVLDICDAHGWKVTNLSLQKILYFCHVWTLIEMRQPLIRHRFEAWEYGPVLQYIYRQFKEFGNAPITKRATRIDKMTGKEVVADYTFDERIKTFLLEKIRFYGQLPASDLINQSHVVGGPWHAAWNHQGSVNPGMKIENADIEKFYLQRGASAFNEESTRIL